VCQTVILVKSVVALRRFEIEHYFPPFLFLDMQVSYPETKKLGTLQAKGHIVADAVTEKTTHIIHADDGTATSSKNR
jgi:hypothetical protein